MSKFFRALSAVYVVLALAVSTPLSPAYHTNFYRPHDVDFRLQHFINDSFRCGATAEVGVASTESFDNTGKKTSLLKMYAPSQSAQAMLADREARYLASEDPEQYFQSTVQQTYNDLWGEFDLSGGKFRSVQTVLWAHGLIQLPESFPGKLHISGYLPIRSMRIDDVTWKDLTSRYDLGNLERINEFTSSLKEFANRVGGLDLEAWNKIGQGDLTFLLNWHNDYEQNRDGIKFVRINGGFGISLPTSRTLENDINKVFSMPLGNDGAFGIPVHGGIEVFLPYKLSIGASMDLLWLSNTTKARRLKTRTAQTDYLLLSKGRATQKHGTSWRFSIFSQTDFFKGFSFSLAYHFLKSGNDTYIPDGGTFLESVVNSSETLKERSAHDLVARLYYCHNKQPSTDDDSITTPSISLFYKLPVTGRRIIRSSTFGTEFSFSF